MIPILFTIYITAWGLLLGVLTVVALALWSCTPTPWKELT